MEKIHTLVIGGGQAGLATSYHLQQAGIAHLVLEKDARTGDVWRNRWDSLRLFIPTQYNNLPGMDFPLPKDTMATKDQTAEYLEQYAGHFELPILHGVTVTKVEKITPGFRVTTNDTVYHAKNVVVCTGPYQKPKIPPFANNLDPGIAQLHTSHYKNPTQIGPGKVLVVGAAASGMQISAELSKTHSVTLSGNPVGNIPIKLLNKNFFWWLYGLGIMDINVNSIPFKWIIGPASKRGDTVIGMPYKAFTRQHGIETMSRVKDIQGKEIRFESDASVDTFQTVIWATGFHLDFSWIDLPIFEDSGYPKQSRGIANGVKGLYFMGLRLMAYPNSAQLGGVGRDAEYIVWRIRENKD